MTQVMRKAANRASKVKRIVLAWTISVGLLPSLALVCGAQSSPVPVADREKEEYAHRIFTTREGVRDSDVHRKWLDIPYANLSSSEKLDIYLPEDGVVPFPVIVAIHGGGFLRGDKRDFQIVPVMQALKHGYAVVSINYRLSGEAKFPGQIQDVKAAIRWIRANARKYSLDPGKIAVWGDSAGGKLAALAGSSAGVRELEDLGMGNAEQSSKVAAVVDWYGMTRFNADDGSHYLEKVGIKLFSKTRDEAPEQYERANPEKYVSKNTPPFLIQHGDVDQIVPVQQSIDFASRLRAVGGNEKVTLEIVEGADHLDPAFTTPENLDKVLRFLDRNLK